MKRLSSPVTGSLSFTVQLAPNSVTACSSEVHVCAEWWQSVQHSSNGLLYRSTKEFDFESVAEMFAVKKASEALNLSKEGRLKKEPEVLLSWELEKNMELKEIFDIKLPPKDVGNALQLLGFGECSERLLISRKEELKPFLKN
ncbi:hypothetical protein LR48_Vigan10g183800 [Vigna angularis]|uniref:Uncharacterized protein n=1 Tax=Phaseolus angularis TaxID=3914 RepID=A0A0L9VLN4_PHAAN|nr:uncharacterized protein LOC108345151 [Vigna angularis]XP_052723333.1 uncharacterized protein LOC108345151 [Vigna angularis]KOM55946.1 hypothetical protein LR48_Vigan10g183800 [Vigna angularis]